MKRFWIDSQNIQQNSVQLTAEESHHLRDVLRKKRGDLIELTDGKGNRWEGTIHSLQPHVTVTLTPVSNEESALSPRLIYCQAILKQNRMDWLLEKAVEIGVDQIIPFFSERTIVEIPTEREKEKKLNRWKEIALSALKQSGRNQLPEIGPILSFQQLTERWNSESSSLFFLSLPESNESKIKKIGLEFIRNLHQNKEKINEWVFMIGPEGGWTEKEKQTGEKLFQPVSIGNQTLRAETAGLKVLSILNMIREDEEV